MLLRNMNNKDNDDVFELGLKLFREEDEIPLFKKALSTYVKNLSYVIEERRIHSVRDGEIDKEEEKDKVIGFALVCKKMTHVYRKFMTGIPNCYELSFLGVNPEYQGKGYGSQCLRLTLSSIYRECINFNCWLIVDKVNKGAIKMYQRYGFRVWFEIDDDLKNNKNNKDNTYNNIYTYPSYIMGLSHRRWKTLKI